MKFNWGTKIIMVYVGFVVFMLGMVYMSLMQHFDLVTPEYYAQELRYQEVIDAMNNVTELGEGVALRQTDDYVEIELPGSQASVNDVTVTLYRPDNAKLDRSIALKDRKLLQLPKDDLAPGLYRVKTSWVSEGRPYYHEQPLYVTQ